MRCPARPDRLRPRGSGRRRAARSHTSVPSRCAHDRADGHRDLEVLATRRRAAFDPNRARRRWPGGRGGRGSRAARTRCSTPPATRRRRGRRRRRRGRLGRRGPPAATTPRRRLRPRPARAAAPGRRSRTSPKSLRAAQSAGAPGDLVAGPLAVDARAAPRLDDSLAGHPHVGHEIRRSRPHQVSEQLGVVECRREPRVVGAQPDDVGGATALQQRRPRGRAPRRRPGWRVAAPRPSSLRPGPPRRRGPGGRRGASRPRGGGRRWRQVRRCRDRRGRRGRGARRTVPRPRRACRWTPGSAPRRRRGAASNSTSASSSHTACAASTGPRGRRDRPAVGGARRRSALDEDVLRPPSRRDGSAGARRGRLRLLRGRRQPVGRHRVRGVRTEADVEAALASVPLVEHTARVVQEGLPRVLSGRSKTAVVKTARMPESSECVGHRCGMAVLLAARRHAVGEHLGRAEHHAPVDVVVAHLGLTRPDRLAEPALQGQAVTGAAHQGHGRVAHGSSPSPA